MLEPPRPFDKRLVLLHLNGPLAGIHQITGARSQLGHPDQPPPTALAITREGKEVPVGLVASKRTYWLYKEVMVPQGLGTFDRAQR